MTCVMVTGASTPAGVELIRVLAGDPRISRIVAIHGPSAPPPGPAAEKVIVLHADLTRERDIHTVLFGVARRESVEVIVHLAAHRAAKDSGRDVHALNVESTRILAELSERHPTVRKIVLGSHAEVYRIRSDQATLLFEDHPLELSPRAPQWVRDRVEADLVLCTRMGLSRLSILVLRAAECLAPHTGSQLWDYFGSRVCFTALGFDPMVNLISVEDLAEAFRLAVFAGAQGVFNVPGKETLPLSRAIRLAGCLSIPTPGPLLGPLYQLRGAIAGTDFRYDQNRHRFHLGGILDGGRARAVLGHVPRVPVSWAELPRAQAVLAQRVHRAGGPNEGGTRT